MQYSHSLKKVSKTYRNNLSPDHILTHLLVVKESNIKKSHYYDSFMFISFIFLSLFISYLYAHKDNLSCEVSLFIKVSNRLSPIFLLLYHKVMSLISSAEIMSSIHKMIFLALCVSFEEITELNGRLKKVCKI